MCAARRLGGAAPRGMGARHGGWSQAHSVFSLTLMASITRSGVTWLVRRWRPAGHHVHAGRRETSDYRNYEVSLINWHTYTEGGFTERSLLSAGWTPVK